MSCLASRIVLAFALPLVAWPAVAGAQTLTRIETHNFYGATVSIEEGVRVFRPLPPTSHMIINPGGRTPLSISYNNTTIVDQSAPAGEAQASVYVPRSRPGLYGGFGWYGKHRAHGHHPGLYRVGGHHRSQGVVRRLR